MIVIHERYVTKLWPANESGPAAVIYTGFADRSSPRDQYDFARRLFAGETGLRRSVDLRAGILEGGIPKRAAIISTRFLGDDVDKINGLEWLQVRERSKSESIAKCVELVLQKKIEAIWIPDPKLIFPSLSLAEIAERFVVSAFQGGSVYREADLEDEVWRRTRTRLTASENQSPSAKWLTDDEDDDLPGDEWKRV